MFRCFPPPIPTESLLISRRISKGQSDRGSVTRRTEAPEGSRTAGEDPVARVPLARAPDRESVDAPDAVVPEHAHGTQHAVDIANVEDVRVAVGQQRSRPAVGLVEQEGEHLGERGLGLGFTAEFGDDRGVHRTPVQGMVAQVGLDRLGQGLDLVEEPLFEVTPEAAEPHRTTLLEVVANDELRGEVERGGVDEGEERGLGLLHHLLLDLGHEGLAKRLL